MNIIQPDSTSQETDAPDDKTFITKLLGEMKNQFNKADNKTNMQEEEEDDPSDGISLEETQKTCELTSSVDNNDSELSTSVDESKEDSVSNKSINNDNIDLSENNEDLTRLNGDEKPRLVMKFLKPTSKVTSKTIGGSKKKLRNGSASEQKTEEVNLKRSSRRRSSESILQSAIARKEKSYNESLKPQRSSRQLKPTQKILENLANAAALKLEKTKIKSSKMNDNKQKHTDMDVETDSSEERGFNNKSMNEHQHRRHKNKHYNNKHKKNIKKLKTSDCKDSDSDHTSITTESKDDSCDKYNGRTGRTKSNDERMYRRSQRLSSSRLKDEDDTNDNESSELDNVCTAEDQSIYPAEPECSSVGAELIASRLCLCIKPTLLYTVNENNETLHCKAVDNIGDKLLGCNNVVEEQEIKLFRTSNRVPFMILCDVHKNRLYRHNCCPTCGIFCTQGRFVQCKNDHIYHRDCQICVGNVQCCPHCGMSTPKHDVHVSMTCSSEPVILPTQKTVLRSAKMTFQPKLLETNDGAERSNSPLISASELIPEVPDIANLAAEYDIATLVEAVKEEALDKLALILGSKTVSLTTIIDDTNGFTILHYAVKNGLLNVVHMLVMAGIDVDVYDYEQNTPLMVAILAHVNHVVKYLIKIGSSITLKGTDGMTALHLAAKCGNLKACQMLVNATITKKNYIDCVDDGGWTSLVWACEHGHIEVAKYLISKGADIMLRDVEQNVALHWAAFSGSTEIIEMLLNLGSNINSVNAHGDTPLHIGARQDSYNSVIILLARGADVSIPNKLGETAINCTTKDGECYKTLAINIHLRGIVQYENKLQYILTNDISKGKETNPIQCVNMINSEPKPIDFVYISKNCITTDLNIDLKITSLQACVCEDRCTSSACSCGKNSIRCWYDEEGKLASDFNYADPPMIFECNEACGCNAITCSNRVVQHGLTQRFQLYRTEFKGWAIKTLKSISKGSFVCEYIGEIINDFEADQREDDSYLFDLDNRESDAYCIDARHYGNFARFINHSCSPNLIPIRIFIDHQDLRFPRIALFANRDIHQDEELSFDYGEKFWIIKCKSFTCECSSSSCKYSKDAIGTTIDNYKLKLVENRVG